MKQTLWIIILIVLVTVLGIYFYPSQDKPEITNEDNNEKTIDRGCAGQGETYNSAGTSGPDKCCDGLSDVRGTGYLSIGEECYWTNLEKSSVNTCSDCGNGICEDGETLCGCFEDCQGTKESRYETIEEFCEEGYWDACTFPRKYPGKFSGELNFEHCALCE